LLNQLDGGCHLPFGVTIQGAETAWSLELFYSGEVSASEPLRLHLTGESPDALADEAWIEIEAYRKG